MLDIIELFMRTTKRKGRRSIKIWKPLDVKEFNRKLGRKNALI